MKDYAELLQPRTAKVQQEATFLRRLIALLFDLLVVDVCLATPFAPVFSPLMSRVARGNFLSVTLTNGEVAAMLLIFLVMYCYFALFEYLLKQTPGMMLVGISVDGDTRLLPLLVRNSFILPVFPFIAFWVIEPIAILVWRRGILESLSRTRTLYQQRVNF